MPLKKPATPELIETKPPKIILLGEDDVDDEELLKEVFSTVDNSFSLVFVRKGGTVMSVLEEIMTSSTPCLIILDYNMPELNGAEILEELRKDRRFDKIPKIIWSTSGSETYKSLCLNLGACEYLIKPSNINQLKETVRHMMSFCSVPQTS